MIFSQLTTNKTQLVFNRTALKSQVDNKVVQIKNDTLVNQKIGSCIRIKFVANNIFCSFWSISGKRTFRVRSAGMNKFKSSKRRLFFYGKLFLEAFFKELQQWRQKFRKKEAFFFYSLKVPKRFRKIILKHIARKAAAINFEYSKAFNGCKAKKKRRKKRLGFRSFK